MKNNKHRVSIGLCGFLLLLLCGGCLEKRDREAELEALIEETVEKRLERFREVHRQRCREDIMEEAQRITDSILIVETRRRQTRQRPERPEKPQLRRLRDSTAIGPILSPADSLPEAPDTLPKNSSESSSS